MRGAWIEMSASPMIVACCSASLPVRGAWIEMLLFLPLLFLPLSLPVRGAWIEMFETNLLSLFLTVAPRAGSVD